MASETWHRLLYEAYKRADRILKTENLPAVAYALAEDVLTLAVSYPDGERQGYYSTTREAR
jgi:hypothetical protein